ncbi:hypothetical protein [Sporosarcina sp. PTS2304]|uniref:hypothetical protein n=1 Tax=Sporosarcina sp. PTS2304 TaxID=2283194 RepID=UPI0013B3B0AD|nr:hypothetical protein [Sporosarcina sp. PTS2304]
MNKRVRRLFHKDTIQEEMGLAFESEANESARVRENASGKEYREAVKQVYRETENKRT